MYPKSAFSFDLQQMIVSYVTDGEWRDTLSSELLYLI